MKTRREIQVYSEISCKKMYTLTDKVKEIGGRTENKPERENGDIDEPVPPALWLLNDGTLPHIRRSGDVGRRGSTAGQGRRGRINKAVTKAGLGRGRIRRKHRRHSFFLVEGVVHSSFQFPVARTQQPHNLVVIVYASDLLLKVQ